MDSFGPASELDAVNEMLAAISASPIPSLSLPPPDAATALVLLRGTARDLQEAGWTFNTETSVTLLPNTAGEILIPNDVLRIDSEDADVVQRGNRLWNRETSSFTFANGIAAELTRLLPWDWLPSVARRYITALAIEKFQAAFPPSPELVQVYQRVLLRAERAFQEAEAENGDYNVLDNSFVSSIMQRGG
jgi:hypothetical protein